jgi:hypothetical protein
MENLFKDVFFSGCRHLRRIALLISNNFVPQGRGNTAVGIWIVFCILFGFFCFVLQLILIKFKADKGFYRKINMAFLVFMLSLFVLFNIFYWSSYLGDL